MTTPIFRAILKAFDPSQSLVHVTKPGQGIVNDVFFLCTSSTDLVLKVFDDDAGSWKPQKELAIFSLMQELNIPSPVVLAIDSSRNVAPFIYTLSERIDGHVYTDVFTSLSDEENVRIHGQLGDYLGVLHSNTFSHFGDVYRQAEDLVVGPAHELDRDATGTLRGPFARWPDMHNEIVNTRLRLMRGTEFEDLIPRVDAYFRERSEGARLRHRATLVAYGPSSRKHSHQERPGCGHS